LQKKKKYAGLKPASTKTVAVRSVASFLISTSVDPLFSIKSVASFQKSLGFQPLAISLPCHPSPSALRPLPLPTFRLEAS